MNKNIRNVLIQKLFSSQYLFFDNIPQKNPSQFLNINESLMLNLLKDNINSKLRGIDCLISEKVFHNILSHFLHAHMNKEYTQEVLNSSLRDTLLYHLIDENDFQYTLIKTNIQIDESIINKKLSKNHYPHSFYELFHISGICINTAFSKYHENSATPFSTKFIMNHLSDTDHHIYVIVKDLPLQYESEIQELMNSCIQQFIGIYFQVKFSFTNSQKDSINELLSSIFEEPFTRLSRQYSLIQKLSTTNKDFINHNKSKI